MNLTIPYNAILKELVSAGLSGDDLIAAMTRLEGAQLVGQPVPNQVNTILTKEPESGQPVIAAAPPPRILNPRPTTAEPINYDPEAA